MVVINAATDSDIRIISSEIKSQSKFIWQTICVTLSMVSSIRLDELKSHVCKKSIIVESIKIYDLLKRFGFDDDE